MTKNNTKPLKDTMLIFEPTTSRPWVGLFEVSETGSLKKIWKDAVKASSPSHVHYWPILKKHSKDFPPQKIAVVTGPGSFSFTRSAVNIANGLGFAWDVSVLGVDRAQGSVREKMSAEQIIKITLEKNKVSDSFELENRALPFYIK